MQENRALAGKGLFFVFWGEILTLIGSFLAWIPLFGAILIMAGLIGGIYGYLTASKGESGYMRAVLCMVGQFILSLLNSFLDQGFLSVLLSIIISMLALAVIYYMCQTTGQLVETLDADLAVRAVFLWKFYLCCTAVLVLCSVLSVVPIIRIAATFFSFLVMTAQVVANILYLAFLYRTQKVLREA